jgi:KDO2-lipid IV(A) lauroyltransferase
MTDWFTGKVAYLSARLGLTVGSSLAGTFPTAVNRLSDWLAGVGFYIFAGFRNRSVDNIRIALSPFVDRPAAANMARQSLRNFFRASVEIAIFMSVSDEEFRRKIAIEGREYLDAALAKGKGVMILSAHLGNFFLAGTRLAVEGFPTYVLVNQPRDGKFAQLMDDYRLRVRQKTIHARPRRQALRDLNAVLRNNQIAVIIADEYRSGNGIEVPLFGRAVIARRGPATLALRTGAAVVPASMIRQPDDTLKLVIEPELELDRSGRGKTQIAENTLRITQWLERTVRKYPDQWNWMNIRWCEGQDREPVAEPHHLKQAS